MFFNGAADGYPLIEIEFSAQFSYQPIDLFVAISDEVISVYALTGVKYLIRIRINAPRPSQIAGIKAALIEPVNVNTPLHRLQTHIDTGGGTEFLYHRQYPRLSGTAGNLQHRETERFTVAFQYSIAVAVLPAGFPEQLFCH